MVNGDNMELSVEALKSVLNYDPATGVFTWLATRGKRKAGDRAGSLYKNTGYRTVMVFWRPYREHRLAWLYMTGDWPKDVIDHKNGVRDDNRWINLREATPAENSQNYVRPAGKSGFVGAIPDRGQWLSRISVGSRSIFLGRFDTPEEAAAAYASAKTRLHTFQPTDRRLIDQVA